MIGYEKEGREAEKGGKELKQLRQTFNNLGSVQILYTSAQEHKRIKL